MKGVILEALAQSAALVDAPDDAAGFKPSLSLISEREPNASSEGYFLRFCRFQCSSKCFKQPSAEAGSAKDKEPAANWRPAAPATSATSLVASLAVDR